MLLAADDGDDDARLALQDRLAVRSGDLAERKWVQLAVESGCSDELITWLVHDVGEPVSDYALECACRNDWWKTTLPILLASNNFVTDGVCELKYSILHPAQLAVLPRMFQDVGKTLQLHTHSWVFTAASAAYTAANEEELAAVRTILGSMNAVRRDSFLFATFNNTASNRVSIRKWYERMGGEKERANVADLQPHVDWINDAMSLNLLWPCAMLLTL